MLMLHTPTEAANWLRSRVRGTLTSDSRQVKAGDGFVAWPGTAVDARQFANSAVKQGAVACLLEREDVEQFQLSGESFAAYQGLKADTGHIAASFYGHPSRELAVIAVTGTNGKTSTAWWLAQALSRLPTSWARPCGVIGTLGVGVPPDVTSTGLTTPDPVLLQLTLRDFVDAGLKACAMEASSIGVMEGRLDGTTVRTAVFTNFTQDHLDYHGSMEAYWEAKRRVFYWEGLQCAVINIDDVKGIQLADHLRTSAVDVWTTSIHQSARIQGRNIQYTPQGLSFEVVEGDDSLVLQSRLIGSFNVANVLGVIAAMRSLGIPLSQSVQVCAQLQPVPGRMECLVQADQPLVAVDYAHTPDALEQALQALRPLAQERKGALWCVFGCGGDRDTLKRPLMGAIAARHSDQVVVTSDNPRSEKQEAIIAQILLGISNASDVVVEMDRARAISRAISNADVKDVILIAGKGHEAFQEIAGQKMDFLDRSYAERALEVRRDAVGVQS